MATEEQTRAEMFAFSTPGQPTSEAQYEAFLLAWQTRMMIRIRKFGFDPEETEDIFADTLEYIITTDGLSGYRPELGVPAQYVFGLLKKRVMKYVDDRKKSYQRLAELEVADFEGVATAAFEYSESILPDLIQAMREEPVRNTRDMHRLVTDLLKQVTIGAGKNQVELALKYKISPSAVKLQMDDLRAAILRRGLVVEDGPGSLRWADHRPVKLVNQPVNQPVNQSGWTPEAWPQELARRRVIAESYNYDLAQIPYQLLP